MPRTKKSVEDVASPASVDRLAHQVQALTVQLESLTARLELLDQTIEEFRQDFQWAALNGRCQKDRAIMHITSIPKDVMAPDFGTRVNRYSAKDLPQGNDQEAMSRTATEHQGELFA